MRDKPIRLSGHAREQLTHRGAVEEEVIQTIRSIPWGPAEMGRMECRMDFPYGKEWNGRVYNTKQVRPIFVEEESEIVVTIYTYFF